MKAEEPKWPVKLLHTEAIYDSNSKRFGVRRNSVPSFAVYWLCDPGNAHSELVFLQVQHVIIHLLGDR